MREYARVESNPQILRGGANLSAVLFALDESQMDSVLVCHGDESGGGSQVTRLGDMDIAGAFGLRGGLGDFVTRGALEEHPCRQYPGGGANRQYPSSISPAMCRHVRSSYWRPMIWMPTGSPSTSPIGATVEGR